jgi:hypothetical protein
VRRLGFSRTRTDAGPPERSEEIVRRGNRTSSFALQKCVGDSRVRLNRVRARILRILAGRHGGEVLDHARAGTPGFSTPFLAMTLRAGSVVRAPESRTGF